MSWSMYATVEEGDSVEDVIHAMILPDGYIASDETLEQVAVGKQAAIAIINSGALGPATYEGHAFHVNLSGHANPSHAVVQGWSNDMIHISVSRAK